MNMKARIKEIRYRYVAMRVLSKRHESRCLDTGLWKLSTEKTDE